MNKLKKTLVLVCCAALLVCISVGATLAYLTSKTEVVNNTFTVGKVKIDLDEAPVDEDGKVIEGDRVKTNEYKLMPGHEYVKDPTVHVDPVSEESYIRTFVTVTKYNEIAAIIRAKYGIDLTDEQVAAKMSDCIGGYDKNVWEDTAASIKFDSANNSVTYEFRLRDTWTLTEDGEDLVLFETLTVPGWVNNAQIDTIENMKINIIAEAIQADGFAADGDKTAADVAWEAFDGQMNTSGENA